MTSIAELRDLARENVPLGFFEHFDGGVDDEVTLRDNTSAFQRVKLVQKVLRDVEQCSVATDVLGGQVSFPVLLAPAGHHGQAHPDGELATARAAEDAGTVMILSAGSTYSMEEVRAVSNGRLWSQLFKLMDVSITEDLVRRAESAGYEAIVLTVDTQVVGNLERNNKRWNGSYLKMREGNLEKYGNPGTFGNLFSPSLTWQDVEWLRGITTLPLVLKGIQTVEDAARAVDTGIECIYVSNHGGRQLDSTASSIELLPDVVDTVAGRAEILIDGGFRRGTDVAKALAIGATAVCVGRPIIFGLGARGQQGVQDALEALRTELLRGLRLMGCSDVTTLDRTWLRFSRDFGFH